MNQTDMHVLVVDDDTAVRDFLQVLLERQGYYADAAADAPTALVMLQQRDYDLVLIDVKMPGMDGITLLREMRHVGLVTEVIVLTGYGTIESAVEAMRLGAYDYLTKPPDTTKLCLVIAKALEKAGLQRKNARLQAALDRRDDQIQMVGQSTAMQQIRSLITQVAKVESTVLIQGQTGTGKELAAHAVHDQSDRHAELFLALNCATIPEALLGSELFGHERSAFTGATDTKIGLFEAADQGTIFLDELTEMPPPMQASLLRTLESGEFRRVGSNQPRFTRARMIAATNRDLQAEVVAGRFRSDLFYRLNVVTINLPPLTQRAGDIPLLADHFLATNVQRTGKSIQGFTDGAARLLESYDWPGNVRELSNVIERAVLLCDGVLLDAPDLHLSALSSLQTGSAYSDTWTLEEMERRHIERAFERNQRRRDSTATQLGISVRTLYRKLRKYEIIEAD